MNSGKNMTAVEEKDLKYFELHRAESVVNEHVVILEQLKADKEYDVRESVIHYVGNKARSVTSRIPTMTAEVVMFLFIFSYIMRSITSMTMIMDKVCIVHLRYSEDTCKNIKDFPEIKSEVEKMANNYHLGHTLLQLIPSAVLALFIGSWSDKYGRRFPIIAAQLGVIIDGLGTTICAHYFYSRVEFYFIPALFTGFSGGIIGVFISMYSYVSDVSASGKRTIKYAFMEFAFGLALPLGSLTGGWIFKFYSFVPVFLISTCGHILGLICVVFFLKETRGLDNKDNWITKFRNFWSLEAVVSSFKTTAKKRPNRGREQIWYLVLGMSIAIFSFTSLAGITFIYVHHRYNWGNTTYSTISSVYSVIGLAVMMIIVPLSKKWNIADPVLGIIGSVSVMMKNIATGLAYKTWIFHLGHALGLFAVLLSLAGRSRISQLVPKEDLGKVFAFLTTAEAILPVVSSAIITQSFNATLDFSPGLMYIIMGVLIVIPLSVFIWIARLPVTNYEEMEDGPSPEETEVETPEKLQPTNQ